MFSGVNRVFGVVSRRFGVIFGRFGVVWGVLGWFGVFPRTRLRYWIFGENFCLLEGRKNIFLSASRSQFVLKRPAKILKIGQQIKFLWPK